MFLEASCFHAVFSLSVCVCVCDVVMFLMLRTKKLSKSANVSRSYSKEVARFLETWCVVRWLQLW